jgi:hypothetical protein
MEFRQNPDLQLAFDFVQYTNRNIFLTGKAGTGKTTFLHHLKKVSPKRMIVVAPTGVAAINAGGVTIHSFFQLPFHPHIPTHYLKPLYEPGSPEQHGSQSYKISREKVNIIKSLDLLVIDEISMVRADLLDAVDGILRRYKERNLAFGGVQLLMIGDLQQLAPVVKEDDRDVIDKYYDTAFFFGSIALSQTSYITIELKQIYRQSDLNFINLLNKIRDNQVDSDTLCQLNIRYDPGFKADTDSGYITLTTHNAQAQSINNSRLDQLPGKPKVFKATVKDDFPDYNYPTSYELYLKAGAQVMFVKNDISKDKLFFNGKIGRIEGFEDDCIVVQCPEDDSPIRVDRVEWQNMKYTLDEETKEIQETIIGTFTQYPLKLAWAITIHKSQGLTFEKVVIDAHSAFAYGQVYVAFSRCRTLEGIVLSSELKNRGFISDPMVTRFVKDLAQNQPDDKILTRAMTEYQQVMISELFGFDPILHGIFSCQKLLNENKTVFIGNANEKLTALVKIIKSDLIEVADRFSLQWRQIFHQNADPESNMQLQERIMKACSFFTTRLESMKGDISEIHLETDNSTFRKSFNSLFQKVRQEIAIKSACLEECKSGFTIKKYLETKAKSAIEPAVSKTPSKRSVEDTSGIVKHPVLFSRLRMWRNQMASAINLPHYMILPQKTMVSLVNFLPQTISEMRAIKGMGQKKVNAYGQGILDIIIAYCYERNITPSPLAISDTKPKVREKTDTKTVSFNLYKSGKSINQIAEERLMAVSTIEGHLAHFVQTGNLSVHEFVKPPILAKIINYFENKSDFKAGPAKEALGDNVTWTDLRFVIKHVEFLNKTKKGQNDLQKS